VVAVHLLDQSLVKPREHPMSNGPERIRSTKQQAFLIEVINPPPLRKSVILLQADENNALEIARKAAAATGRPVIIIDQDMVEIRIAPAKKIQ